MFPSRKVSFFFLICSSVTYGNGWTSFWKIEKNKPICQVGSHTQAVGVRHSEGEGIGYTDGYSTLEGFFSLRHGNRCWTPFLDLRGHVFNNGKYAANEGVGVRYVDSSMAWGLNTYYDYRNTNHFHYNQIGVGLETIGSFWKVNINGYLPVGKKKNSLF